MAMDFIDSAAHSGSGSNQIPLSRKWTSYAAATYSTNFTRTSGISIAIQGSIGKTLPYGYKAERWIGFAGYIPQNFVIPFLANFLSGGTFLVSLRLEADATLSLIVGGTNVRIWNSSPLVVTGNTFHYFEFHCLLGGSAPINVTCDVKVDGQFWVQSLTGNTGYNSTNLIIQAALMNGIGFQGPAGVGSAWYLCDLYCATADTVDLNGNTTTFKGFQGDIQVNALIPIADVTVQWAQNPTSPHSYTLVNEIPPDDDTTYVYTDSIGQIETFNFQKLIGFNGTILGAQLLIYAKKDAEGSRAIEGLVGGTAQHNGYGLNNYLYDYYDYFIFPLDTDNGVVWTPAIYNSENFGVSLSA